MKIALDIPVWYVDYDMFCRLRINLEIVAQIRDHKNALYNLENEHFLYRAEHTVNSPIKATA